MGSKQARKQLLKRIDEIATRVLDNKTLRYWHGQQRLIDNEQMIILQIDTNTSYTPYMTKKEFCNGDIT